MHGTHYLRGCDDFGDCAALCISLPTSYLNKKVDYSVKIYVGIRLRLNLHNALEYFAEYFDSSRVFSIYRRLPESVFIACRVETWRSAEVCQIMTKRGGGDLSKSVNQ